MKKWTVGDTWRCFRVVRLAHYGGHYGASYTAVRWECVECGTRFHGDQPHRHMEKHADQGHAPCERCGRVLLRRQDGTPRQHAHNRCPGKNPGHRIEAEFVKNMSVREYR